MSKTQSEAPMGAPKKKLLCDFKEAESWQQENKYLVHGYRTPNHSYLASLASLAYLHNQTSNVYTHLIGAALFLAWAYQACNDILQRYSTADTHDWLVFSVYAAGAVICFGSSALFHLFSDHSGPVLKTWLLFDLYGVFVLITVTVFSGTYYGFYCDQFWWKAYTGGILAITLTSAVVCSKPMFEPVIWRNVRAALFVSIGFYGCVPMTHLVQVWGREQADKMFGWDLMLYEGLCYFAGALIYGYRIPERLIPGRFDIWGASHQLFHVAAVIGAALHYHAMLRAFDYNHSHSTSSRSC